jgi:hypothetical protein
VPEASGLIVARVRHRRRRRHVIEAGASIVAVAVLSGAVLTGLGARDPGSGRPATKPVPAASGSAAPDQTATELRMTGSSVGSLRLGMSRAEAEATGLLVLPGTVNDNEHPDCRRYDGRRGIESVLIGPHGVSDIQVYTFIPTPEGAAIGDSYQQVRAKYPALPATPGGETEYRVPVSGAAGAWYVFTFSSGSGDGEHLTQASPALNLSLRGNDSGCE